MNFLAEHHILTELNAVSLGEAIGTLAGHLVRAYDLDVDAAWLSQAAMERESEASTCLGAGLAVPHCILPAGLPLCAVLGLSPKGIDEATPDAEPLRCVFLLATPEDQRQHHLQMLSAIAQTLGTDAARRERLLAAVDAAEALAVLHAD